MDLEPCAEDRAETCSAVTGSGRPSAGEGSREAVTSAAPQDVRWWIRAALAFLFALYVRAVGFDPVYDDNVIGNWVGWRDVPKFFMHDIFGSDGQAHSVYYRPVATTWAFLLGWATGGAPAWLHLGAILLHLAVVVLAFVFGRKLFADVRLAGLTALLFGLHPSKVESVAWIGSSCVDGLGGVFFFASLIAFLNWRASESLESGASESGTSKSALRWWAASVAWFAAAMFTKETMVCIPILIAAYLWLDPEGGTGRKASQPAARWILLLRSLAPYAVVWTIYTAIRHQVIKPASSAADYLHPTFTLANIWTAPYSIWWYLRHLAMPFGLSVEYTLTVLEHPTLRGFVLPALGLIALALAAWGLWRKQRSALAAFLGCWFVLNLAPPVIVAPMVQQHDRYLYLSAYPFCALLAWAILRFGKLPPRARMALGLGLVALLSALTWHEMGYWDNDATLWARVLQTSPSNIKAEVQMAGIYNGAGDQRRALALLEDGLRYHPDSPGIWLTRAGILAGNKRLDEARAAYLNVLRVTEPVAGQAVPPGPRANLRASAAYRLALMDVSSGNFREGEHYARTALGLRFDGVGFHAALAESLSGQGRKQEADAERVTELRLRIEQQRRATGQHP
jgi:protein O-mannosyl-transferase